MKATTVVLLSTALACQGALIPLAISPPGTDSAVGLSPTNEVPPLTGDGSGGELMTNGIIFNSDTFELQLSVGYGSAEGFTDLTGPAVTAAIYGPADTNMIAGPLYDLGPLTMSAINPALGGTISGTVYYASNDVPGLLAGLNYISIATSNNPDGEIRGQLIPQDVPPLLNCPGDSTVSCGSPLDFTASVFDTVGNSVEVIWSLNGMMVQTNEIPAFAPPAATNVTFTAQLPVGTNTLQVDALNAAGSSASCASTITVVDTNPPVIVSAEASPNLLWPPNHKMVKIQVSADVTDNCSATTWKIVDVQSDEDVYAKGSGHTAPDWKVLSDHCLYLRAERSGRGDGRTYTITLQAQDTSGNISTNKTVTVNVPHNKPKKAKKPKKEKTKKEKASKSKVQKNKGNNNGNANGKSKGQSNGKFNGNSLNSLLGNH